jgi:hypothetical protein
MLERDLERMFVKAVRDAGGRAYKFTSPARRGVPDRLVVFQDKPVCFVELKRPGGKPTKLQEIEIRNLVALGQRVFVIDRPSLIEDFIKEYQA